MKPRILFFPPAWSDETIFTSQAQFLSKQYEVVFPNIHQFDNIESMTDFVAKKYSSVYAMLGLSLGGYVVQDLLTRYPTFTQKAALLASPANAIDEATKTFYRDIIQQVQDGRLADIIPMYTEVVLSGRGLSKPELVNKVKQLPFSLGQQGCINHHEAIIAWTDHREALKQVQADVLIMAGEHDKAIPVIDLKTLHELIPHSTFQIIPGAGHFMNLEQETIVNRRLAGWLTL